jgi:hypothetical protein
MQNFFFEDLNFDWLPLPRTWEKIQWSRFGFLKKHTIMLALTSEGLLTSKRYSCGRKGLYKQVLETLKPGKTVKT